MILSVCRERQMRERVAARAGTRDRRDGFTAPVDGVPLPSRQRFFALADGTATARVVPVATRHLTAATAVATGQENLEYHQVFTAPISDLRYRHLARAGCERCAGDAA